MFALLQRSYICGAAGLISDTGPTDQGVQPRFYLFDALGNTRLLLKSNGATYQTCYWQPWGGTAFQRSTPFGWNGQYGTYYVTESGLHYMQQRYYYSGIGRFLSRDRGGFLGGPNLYVYCLDDPVNCFDPDGAFWNLKAALVCGLIGGGIEGFSPGGKERGSGAARAAGL